MINQEVRVNAEKGLGGGVTVSRPRGMIMSWGRAVEHQDSIKGLFGWPKVGGSEQ